MQKTWMANKVDVKDEDRKWFLVDATGVPLGRLATRVATILQGKHKPTYTPHVDVGDFVVVINGCKAKLTGNKTETKYYYSHSGYLGNLKQKSYEELREEKSTFPVKEAVRRMLPKNKLARKMAKKLFIYPEKEHPHDDVEFTKLEI